MTTTSTVSPADPASDGPAPQGRGPLWWRRFRLLPRTLRVSTYAAVLLVLVLVAGLLTGVVLVRRSYPQTTGEIAVPGLTGNVEVVRDDHGIPQIYADTTEDLMRAQGYVHAQERFFEMDVRRHATAGRLAEMFGQDAVETDVYVRTMGWRRVAEDELPLLDPDTRIVLDAYAAGVNAYLAGRSPGAIALEYTVLNAGGLGYTPQAWTAVDSLAWLKAMAWDLRGNMVDEIDRTLSAAAVGETRAAQLWPAYPLGDNKPIVAQGAVVDGVFEQDAETSATRLPTRPPPFVESAPLRQDLRDLAAITERMPAWLGRGDGVGSNSWVVSGEHTDTGEPILANDPHLGVSLPGVWMQVGLHCRTVSQACPYDVAGFSFSGVPGVIIGHNADIAWGFTNLGPDVTDLYVERVVGDQWRHGGKLLPLTERGERIEVAGADDVSITVRSTDHGPIVSDVDDVLAEVAEEADVPRETADKADYAVSLSWTALEPSTTADAILALNRARDWTSFRAAVSDFAVPAQNIVYADREGHIGYQAPGRIPIRKSGNDGLVPSAGWRPENDWSGEYVPYDGLPSVLDPQEGFVVTANQEVIGPDYPYYLGADFDRGYRSQRIRDLLAAQLASDPDTGPGTVSVDDALASQRDDRNPVAPVLMPYLLAADLPATYDDDGQRLLETWDFTQPAEGEQSAAAAYFNVVWRDLLEMTFADELPEDQQPDGGQRWMGVMTQLLADPKDPWWDDVTTDEVETRDDLIRAAMLQARDDLTADISPRPEEWTWGRLHQLRLESSTLGSSGVGAVERLFNRGGWDVGGSGSSVDATFWDAREGFDVVTAPSMRMVISLGNLDDSRWINLTGVSGHAFNPHYTDQTDLMAAGKTLPWAFSRGAVEDAGEDLLRLVPSAG